MNGYFDVEVFGVAMAIVLVIVYLAAIGLSIAQYVMSALGLYDTARKRQIRHAWLAWVPLIGNWTLGAVVDWFSARHGRKSRWRTVLLVLSGTIIAGYLLLIVIAFVVGITMGMNGALDEVTMLGLFGSLMLPYLLIIFGAIALLPCRAVCLYKVFEEIKPEKAVKYLLLSYLVPLAAGICMMRCAKVPVEPVQAAEGVFIPQNPFAGLEESEGK